MLKKPEKIVTESAKLKIKDLIVSNVGNGIKAENANWKFKGEAVKNFDEHIKRSVPMYEDGHKIVCDLSDFFITNDSTCYELGCSTGQLSVKLAKHNDHKQSANFIGIDLEQDMIQQAQHSAEQEKVSKLEFICDDILQYQYRQADMIIAYYTVQFVRPSQRQLLIDNIYQSLNWGGAFLLFEKVRANDARFQDIMTSLYNEYKISQGYSADEILSKSRSLKGVLEPFSTQGNLDLLKRAGFVDTISIFKYLSFEGFLSIK
ncbi:MAG: methyltransferase domain-containing protein [Gammaproteobacteria bacterium]|nr:methyltransferase domain-containing protein [Gammaproteobacteria bacterium]